MNNMCTTLTTTKEKALAAYTKGDNKLKAELANLFGQEAFQPITDRVKSFEDACKAVGTTVANVINMDDSADEIAYKQLKVIAAALNEGWKPDWSNDDEQKWYPYFEFTGSGFSLYDVDCHYSSSRVPSRLCFRSRELVEYAAKQFAAIYNDYFIY